MRAIAIAVVALATSSSAFAWDGVDTQTGESVEIGKGNLVRTGRDIEIYDYGSGEYRNVTVEDINRYGSTVEVEVYDSESGEYRILEMDGN